MKLSFNCGPVNTASVYQLVWNSSLATTKTFPFYKNLADIGTKHKFCLAYLFQKILDSNNAFSAKDSFSKFRTLKCG